MGQWRSEEQISDDDERWAAFDHAGAAVQVGGQTPPLANRDECPSARSAIPRQCCCWCAVLRHTNWRDARDPYGPRRRGDLVRRSAQHPLLASSVEARLATTAATAASQACHA